MISKVNGDGGPPPIRSPRHRARDLHAHRLGRAGSPAASRGLLTGIADEPALQCSTRELDALVIGLTLFTASVRAGAVATPAGRWGKPKLSNVGRGIAITRRHIGEGEAESLIHIDR